MSDMYENIPEFAKEKQYGEITGPKDFEAAALTDEQIASYKQDGFLGPIKVFDEEQVTQILDACERIAKPDYPQRNKLIGMDVQEGVSVDEQMIYFQNAWIVEDDIHDAIYTPTICAAAHQLLESDKVRFLHDQMFYKPKQHGGVVAWHQDYSYWTRTEPAGHITCFIALDDCTEENGCIHFVPASNHWDLLPTVKLTGGDDDMSAIHEVLTEDQKAAFKPVPMPLKSGEVSFHHYHTVHGSYSNRSDRHRRCLVLNFMRGDTRSASDQPIMPGTDPVPPGDIIEGPAFPLVFDKTTW